MNDTVIKEKLEEAKEETIVINKLDDVINKLYSISVVGLPYGNVIRETEDFSDAVEIYNKLKNEFYLFNCHVVLQKHEMTEDDGRDTTIYCKQVGNEYEIKKHLNSIEHHLKELESMKRLYSSTTSECDKFISAFTHSLEKINAERLSENQMRNIFRNIEEKSALRRIAKHQTDHLLNLTANLSSIRSNVSKALESYKLFEYNRNTQKAIDNRLAKDQEYLETIGLL